MNNFNKILSKHNTLITHTKSFSFTNVVGVQYQKVGETAKYNSVVREAECVVGYPTSFLSLRWILNDEIANVASHIRRLIGTNHPLLKTSKNLLLRNEQATWGLIVLLVSKMAGLNSNFSELECDKTADILHSQRIIAEVTEMIKTSHLIHSGIVNIDASTESPSDMHFGNNLALLCGDYLLSRSFHEVACLKNYEIQEKISSTLRDLAESQFIGLRDAQNQAIPSKPLPVQKTINIPLRLGVEPFELKDILGNMKAEWTLRNILGGASLLGKCCQCSLILAGHGTDMQEICYTFGRSLALAWQASLEKDLLNEKTFSLVSAPVMFHLEYDPDFYKEIEKALTGDIDYNFIRKSVMNGSGLEKTSQLQNEFSQAALNALDRLPNSDSKKALINIVKSL